MTKIRFISQNEKLSFFLYWKKKLTLSLFRTKMIRKDYILRQIGQILEALIRKFSKIQSGIDTYNPNEIQDLYLKYFNKNAAFFTELSTDEIAQLFKENYDSEEVFARLQVLSELLYGEGQVIKNQQLQLKAIDILQYVLEHSGTFDWETNRRLIEMKKDASR